MEWVKTPHSRTSKNLFYDELTFEAIGVATDRSISEVRKDMNLYDQAWVMFSNSRVARGIRNRGREHRNLASKEVYKPYLQALEWEWVGTMNIGSGVTTHLRSDELPTGRLICVVSMHLVAVIDHVVHCAYDPRREGTRAVYGYFKQKEN